MSVDLENTLVGHLWELGRRESWRVSKLPEGIAERRVAILRLLDKRGWIEVHLWKRVDKHPRPYENPRNLVPMRNPYGDWYSPLRSTSKDRRWKYILEHYTGELAPEIRLTELGWAELDESGHVPPGGNEKPPGEKKDHKLTKKQKEFLGWYADGATREDMQEWADIRKSAYYQRLNTLQAHFPEVFKRADDMRNAKNRSPDAPSTSQKSARVRALRFGKTE